MKVYNRPMFAVGAALAGVGTLVASPIDDAALAATGVGALLTPLTVPVTAVGGVTTAVTGVGLMWLSTQRRAKWG